MKRLASFILLVLCLFTDGALAADFRNASWGMTKEQVYASELLSLKPESQDLGDVLEIFTAKDKLIDLECVVFYAFLDDKLNRSGYLFTNKTHNDEVHVVWFNRVNDLLKGKYGKPVKDEIHIEPNANTRLFISTGDGYMETKWNVANGGFIQHQLYGDNYRVTHRLVYSTYENQKALEHAQKEKAKKLL